MALSPRTVEWCIREGIAISPDERQLAHDLELLVDSQLPRLYRRGRVIRPRFPRFVSRPVVEQLGRRYSANGWHVDIEPPSPRAPGYKLTLTARRTRGLVLSP